MSSMILLVRIGRVITSSAFQGVDDKLTVASQLPASVPEGSPPLLDGHAHEGSITAQPRVHESHLLRVRLDDLFHELPVHLQVRRCIFYRDISGAHQVEVSLEGLEVAAAALMNMSARIHYERRRDTVGSGRGGGSKPLRTAQGPVLSFRFVSFRFVSFCLMPVR